MEETVETIEPAENNEVISAEENATNVGELTVVDLYNEHDNEELEEFNKNIISSL